MGTKATKASRPLCGDGASPLLIRAATLHPGWNKPPLFLPWRRALLHRRRQTMNAFAIRLLRQPTEARFCAEFMIASEPWVTLGLTIEQAFQRLTDPTREVHVATVNDRIVGVLSLHLSGPLNGYIQVIAVHPDRRCRGLGTRMIEFAEERIFRQSPNVFLCVSSFNQHAQKLYARLGYQRVGELPDFAARGCSEILMRKTRGPLLEFKPGN